MLFILKSLIRLKKEKKIEIFKLFNHIYNMIIFKTLDKTYFDFFLKKSYFF